MIDVYEYGWLVYLKTPTSPNTNKLIGAQWVSLTLLQCPQRSRRIAEATTRLALGQPERGIPDPAWPPVGFSRGVLTKDLGPGAAKSTDAGFRVPAPAPLKHHSLPEKPVEIWHQGLISS